MIFVAVGTERFPFDRLVRTVDELAPELDEEVLVQLGSCQHVPASCQWVRMLPYQELVTRIEQASLVIAHGGAGLMLLSVRAGKVPIVLPRLKRHGEHVDDHQLQLVSRMAELGHVRHANDERELAELVRHGPTGATHGGAEPTGESVLGAALGRYLLGVGTGQT